VLKIISNSLVILKRKRKQLLEYVKETKNRYYIDLLLALMTGMRQGEILGLRWRDVGLNRKMISVRQSLSHDGKDFGPPKTQCSIRSIRIDDSTIEMFKQHRKLITKDKWHAKELYVDNDLVVCTIIGTPYMPRILDKLWNKLRDKAKMRKITFHDLRHTHASLLLKNNVHPKVVSERLGHSSIQITLDLYSHLFPNMQIDAVDGIGKMIFQHKDSDKDIAAKEA
jgi:integrase